MAADNGPGNGKAETYAASFAIPRTLHAEKRRENLLLGGIGYPGYIIGDDEFDTICSSLHADPRPLAITNGIFDEVAAGAAECVWSAAVADLFSLGERDVITEFRKIVAQTFHESREVHGPCVFCACVFASKCERRLRH